MQKEPLCLSRLAFSFCLLLCFAFAPQLRAETMTYTATGGLISGTLGGVTFTDAAWSITATADTANITQGNFSAAIPYYFLPASAVLTIDGFSPVTFTSPNFGVFSGDYSIVLSPNVALSGFADFNVSGNTSGLAAYGFNIFTDLATPVTLNAESSIANKDYTFTTSGGDFVISADTGAPGTFSVESVPEPSTCALLGVAGACLAFMRRRR